MERLEQAGLNRARISAEAALPLEWRIEGLVRASEYRQSERWRVWAAGPNSERIEAEGDGEVAALQTLAHKLRQVRGLVSG